MPRALLLALALGCAPTKVVTDDSAGPAPGDDTTLPETGDSGSAGCPTMTASILPGPAQILGPLDPLELSTDAVDGSTLTLSAEDGVTLDGILDADVVDGSARFDAVTTLTPGLLTLDVAAEGCDPGLRVGPLVVGAALRSEPAWLPGGRVGASYAEITSFEAVQEAKLPPGLSAAEGWLSGLPTTEGSYRFEAAAREGDDVVRYVARLAVFPADDAMEDAPSEPSDPGDHEVGALELSVPSVDTSRGTLTDLAVRVAFPADANGPFPLIVFHHAAHSPAQIYDRYTELHDHWASHGYVVASVDDSALVSTSQSWQNLTDMSTVQLAAMSRLLEASDEEGSPLYGLVDADAVLVAGHSRGGGASLISLWREPSLLGAICFEQVSPIQTPNQDWSDADGNGDRPYPRRPILFVAAGDDLDENWPLPQASYDQALGPTVFVTLHGTNHEWTYDEGTPGGVTSASDISWDERHALDQHYSTAFLERFARGDLTWESSLFSLDALSSDLSDRGVSVYGRRDLDDALLVDDFSGEASENLLGGANTGSGLSTDDNEPPYTDGLEATGRGSEQIARIATWTAARELSWEGDATLRLALSPDGEGLDLSDQRELTLRLSAPCDPPPGDCPEVAPEVQVALIDADGQEQALDAADGMGALGVVGRHWSEVLLPLDAFLPLDLSRVTAVELRLSAAEAPDDALWVDDVGFE